MSQSIAIALFSVSVVFILYIILGYPLILDVVARLRPQPVRKARVQKPVSVVVAVHNAVPSDWKDHETRWSKARDAIRKAYFAGRLTRGVVIRLRDLARKCGDERLALDLDEQLKRLP